MGQLVDRQGLLTLHSIRQSPFRSCIEAVASAHARAKEKKAQQQIGAAQGGPTESYFTSLDTCMEQVRV